MFYLVWPGASRGQADVARGAPSGGGDGVLGLADRDGSGQACSSSAAFHKLAELRSICSYMYFLY